MRAMAGSTGGFAGGAGAGGAPHAATNNRTRTARMAEETTPLDTASVITDGCLADSNSRGCCCSDREPTTGDTGAGARRPYMFVRVSLLLLLVSSTAIAQTELPPPETTPDASQPAAPAETPPEPLPAPPVEPPPPPAPAPVPEPVPPEKPAVELEAGAGKGVTLKSKKFSLNIRSRFQIRYELFVPPAPTTGDRKLEQSTSIGTARLWLSGHALVPDLKYMVQLAVAGRDYRDGATSPIFDAFLDWKRHRDFSVRAGQYFVPFDRLRTVREFALQMADRPRPVGELTLDRDVGVTAYSEKFLDSPVAWYVSAFGGGGTNLTRGRKPGVLLVARAEVRPLGPIDDDSEGDLERREKPGLALGGAVAGNWNTDRVRSTTGATYLGGTTDYRHAAVDATFKWRGIGAQAEYLWKSARRDTIVSTDAAGMTLTEYTRSAHGWIVQASYIFPKPFEIVGRVSHMKPYAGTDPKLVTELDTRGHELGAGANYYINGHRFKLQTDWIVRMPSAFDVGEGQHVFHVQLDATF